MQAVSEHDDDVYGSSGFESDSASFEEEVDDIEEELDHEDSIDRQSVDDTIYLQNGGIDISYESDIKTDFESSDDISYTDPEVMLTKLLNVNIEGDFNIAKRNRIRCLALCKIIYGGNHWRVAEAHVQLANVYLKGKYYPQQVLKHTQIARDLLLSVNKRDTSDESKREYLLENLYYLMGRVNYQLSKYKVSENLLMKAKLVSDHSTNATSKFLTMKINILTALASTLSKLTQLGQAIEYLEEAIEIAGKMSGSAKYISIDIHKQLVTIELMNGKDANIPFAMESALKAFELSVSFTGNDSTATAEILILISRVEIVKDIPDYSSIEKRLQRALEIYTALENKGKIIQTQEMICKVYMKQEKFPAAKSILKEAITVCENTYGDMSLQSADLYELMGNSLFAENKMAAALTYLLKAEDTLKERKRYQNKQAKISALIEVIKKSQLKTSQLKAKERPRFN